ncbi:MAG: acyl--CoA ligase [Chloroflexi bacterium]|nr:acyl--CoA ligase [Chloroflexota bacterium]
MSDPNADEKTLALIRAARHIDHIPPEHYRVPFRNIRHALTQHTYTQSNKTYLIYYDAEGNRTELTYGEFLARASQIANYLHDDLGVRRGDRVATIAYNHSDTVLIYYACWLIGAAVAPQNIAEDDKRIAFILRNSEAVVCLVRAEYVPRAEHIIKGTDEGLGAPNIREIVVLGTDKETRALPYPALYEMVRRLSTSYLADDSMPKANDTALRPAGAETPGLEDEALLVYTSGTTGAPKGVVLTQYNLLVDAQGIAQWQAITGNQRMMCVLPIHHVNGIVVTLITPMLVGGSTVLNRAFSASHFWERVIADKVHVVSVVPTLLQFLLEYGQKQLEAGHTIFGEGIHRRGLIHFRHFICGAGTLSMALAQSFEETFGFPILHGYGLSETTCYSCHLPIDLTWDEHRRWMYDYGYPSIGCPIQPNEMAIFAPDGSGELLPPGERGEICIRGHNVMRYYFKRPDANAETFNFGWFRSGDEGFYKQDARGRKFFFITGRLKELINRGGVKFSPFDIEEVLMQYPGVKVALAVAFKNTYYGEEVGAYVVAEAGKTLDAEAILAHCRAQMSFEKAPKVVVFGTEIPVTSTGKYQRLRLQDLFSAWEHTQFRK